jgi:hypothetical protein
MSLPEGYNLRGLIVTYLEEHGWVWSDEDESWTWGGIRYWGEYATDLTMQHQIEEEEGRSVRFGGNDG